MAQWGLPYQGSKGAFAGRLYRGMIARSGEGRSRLVEPFAGGFAVGHYFASKGWSVDASDLDKYTVALLRAINDGTVFDGGKNERLTYAWVSRKDFFRAVEAPEETGHPDWHIGLVRNLWSFGNGGTSYLYGAPLEKLKQAGHMLAAEGVTSSYINGLIAPSVQRQIAALPTVLSRRRGIQRALAPNFSGSKAATSKAATNLKQIQFLERLDRAKSMHSIVSPTRVDRLKGMSYIPPQRVSVTCRGYEEALDQPLDDAIVYLDPPYADTEGYAAGQFDSRKFWATAESVAASVPVFVSEYSAPDGWEPALAWTRPETYSVPTGKTRGTRQEKLYQWKG